jgi:hypothetical protein
MEIICRSDRAANFGKIILPLKAFDRKWLGGVHTIEHTRGFCKLYYGNSRIMHEMTDLFRKN